MKVKIERNTVQRHHNMFQKYLDQEEIEDIDEIESYNENSLKVGSECSVRDTVAESAPIFKKSNCLNDLRQTIKENLESNNVFDFKDELPEIQKQLRNGNLEISIKKLKILLENEFLTVSERIKYKNQVIYLKFVFKEKQFELRAMISKDVLLQQKLNKILLQY